MKVLMVNGPTHKNGCTRAALGVVAEALGEAGVDAGRKAGIEPSVLEAKRDVTSSIG